MRVVKQGSLRSQGVHGGCRGLRMSAHTADPVVEIVDTNEDDIRRSSRKVGGKKEAGQKCSQLFHKYRLNSQCSKVVSLVDQLTYWSRKRVGHLDKSEIAHGDVVGHSGEFVAVS